MKKELKEGTYIAIIKNRRTRRYLITKLNKSSIHVIDIEEISWNIQNDNYFDNFQKSLKIIDQISGISILRKNLEKKLMEWKILQERIVWLDKNHQIHDDTKNAMLRIARSKIRRCKKIKKIYGEIGNIERYLFSTKICYFYKIVDFFKIKKSRPGSRIYIETCCILLYSL